MLPFNLLRSFLLITLLVPSILAAQVKDTLAIQDFESVPMTPTWNYAGTPAYLISGFSGNLATPANSPVGINGSQAWQVYSVSGGNQLTFANQIIPTGYDSVRVSFRLAAMNLNSGSGGPDNLDYVLVAYSLDNGVTFNNRVRVRGAINNNCSWPYAAGSSAEVYYLPAQEAVFQPVNSGLQIADGIGFVEITFPGNITQLALRITPRSSSTSDHWLIDNVVLTAESNCASPTSTLVLSGCDSVFAPNGQVYSATGVYNDTLSNSAGCDSIISYDITIANTTADSIQVSECDNYLSPGGQIYAVSGIYVDTLTNVNGCDSLIYIDLTIGNSSNDTLIAQSCGPYISPTGMVYTTNGIYVDSLLSNLGCDSLVTTNLTIIQVDTGFTVNGGNLVANAIGASYQWYDCDANQPITGETDSVFTPAGNGTFALITTRNGCSDTSDCRFVVVVALDGQSNTDIQLWPQPAQDLFRISSQSEIQNVQLDLLDLRGRSLLSETIDVLGEWEGSLAEIAPGIYFIRLQTDQFVLTRRLVVQ